MRQPKGRNDGHIADHSKITDLIYLGSNLCKGNSCPVHSEEFKELGVCVELNLDNERKEIPPDDIESYSWLPVVDGYAPTQIQLAIGSSIINESVRRKKVVYVHCRNGHGRGPTMVVAYLIRYEGYDVDQAIKLIKEKRPEIHIEKNQMEVLRKFKKRLSD